MQEIQCLREEFATPRKKLWDEFDAIQTEHKLRIAHNKARKLEAAIQSIVPAAFPKESYPLKFGWEAAKLAVKFFVSGNFMPAVKYAVDTSLQLNEHKRQVSRVEVAKVLASNLHNASGLIVGMKKHLSPAELKSLGILN